MAARSSRSPNKARDERELDAYVVRFSTEFKQYIQAIRLQLGLPLDGLEHDAARAWLSDHLAEHKRLVRERATAETSATSRMRVLADSPGGPSIASSEDTHRSSIEALAATDRLWDWRGRSALDFPLFRMVVAVFHIFDLPEPEVLAGYAFRQVVGWKGPVLSAASVNSAYSPRARIQRTVDSATITLTGVSDGLSKKRWTSYWTDAIKRVVQRRDEWIDKTVELPGPVRRAHLPWRVRAYELHEELECTIAKTLAQIRVEFPDEFASAGTPTDDAGRLRKVYAGIADIRDRVKTLDLRARARGADAG